MTFVSSRCAPSTGAHEQMPTGWKNALASAPPLLAATGTYRFPARIRTTAGCAHIRHRFRLRSACNWAREVRLPRFGWKPRLRCTTNSLRLLWPRAESRIQSSMALTSSRAMLLSTAAMCQMLSVGCVSAPEVSADASSSYCIPRAHGRKPLCASGPLPSAVTEEDAKRFEASPGLLTIYIVRGRRADAVRPVKVALDGSLEVVTLPRSMARLRVQPGPHVLELEWQGEVRRQEIDGRAGEILFVEVTGSSSQGRHSFYWANANPAATKERAMASRLIADLRH